VRDIGFRRYEAEAAGTLREVVAAIHRDAYAHVIASGDPFGTQEAFMRRFDVHITNPSLDLVVAYVGDKPVGQTWGWPLAKGSGASVWKGLVPEPKPGFTDEDGKRTFAFAEIMVRKAWTGQGIAHALHDELLGARSERRAELYVRPRNTNAYRAYLKWGWQKVGEIRPDLPDAPLFDVLVLPLPIARTAPLRHDVQG
jgi:GNAT superfamily N-acetyltransferase